MSYTLLLLLEYDGTHYAGWQRQRGARTVQATLEDALTQLLGFPVRAVAAGRTDAGVHARGQVVHVRLPTIPRIPEERIPRALNSLLPDDLLVRAARLSERPIHVRYDACARAYSYMITNRPSVFSRHFSWYVPVPLDGELLQAATSLFVGRHDFTTFSKHDPSTKSYICSVTEAHWSQPCPYSWRFYIRADRFVYGMVRALVGAMVQVAQRRRTLEELQHALAARDRRYASPLAPPHGLVLESVFYPPDIQVLFPQVSEEPCCLCPCSRH
ncbi:MAG: tRNA pseudouridine(38-40) synthase TruA [Candidatus Kapabacteria bacterium]|nr:tRNA pseudouridine(38-40) synthase TruA [Candidatus Kapabacteria bacterium]MDW8011553.1 tRNA pseudouridine(38-40) synthase TruA [Bacteroidota bacterium]